MSHPNDFVIINGELSEYTGTEDHAVIPKEAEMLEEAEISHGLE